MNEDQLFREITTCEITQSRSNMEEALSKNALIAYTYALKVLKGPFPLGEDAIASSASYSYKYARDILKGRFRKGEKNLLDSSYIEHYCTDVYKEPWPEAEKVLIQVGGPTLLIRYAKNCLGGNRFEDAEETIWRAGPTAIADYFEVVGQCFRNEKYEHFLDYHEGLEYMTLLGMRIPSLEHKFLENCRQNATMYDFDREVLTYIYRVIGGRWQEYEDIANDRGVKIEDYDYLMDRHFPRINHQCEAVNVSFMGIRLACKHCGRNMKA